MLDTSLERVQPIYVIGDSHVLPYRNMVFRESFTGSWIVVKSKYVPGLSANNFLDATTEELHPGVLQFLEYEGLVREGRASHLATDETTFAIAQASSQPQTTPLLLLSVGDIDVRLGVVGHLLGSTHDFVPPFETNLPLQDLPLVPYDVIEATMLRLIAPLAAGVRQLIASGFTRIYMQSVVPPTTNEVRFETMHGFRCSVSVRTKLVMVFNRLLAAQLTPAGVKVLDIWSNLTANGFLRADLEVDGVHLPPRAARQYLDALIAHAIDCQWKATNYVRYELFYRLACGVAPCWDRTNSDSAA